MNQEEITQGNILIAKFMGNKEYRLEAFRGSVSTLDNFIENPCYNNSWDWLMPVVEKIETLSFKKGRHFYLHVTQCYVHFRIDRMNNDLFSQWGSGGGHGKLKATYSAVVEFINWDNKVKH
tara:strand:+ start:348 stop:710 length:363 start_codon:yes stop_codon:yes gene_type:complete